MSHRLWLTLLAPLSSSIVVGCSSPRPAGSGGSDGAAADTGAAEGGSDSGADGGARCSGTGATGYNRYKYAYFGDLHSHTSYSLDAYSFGTRSDPGNAYLFAKGQAMVHVGSATDGDAGPTIAQPRPIDFLAVTDHGEWLFATHGCTLDPDSGYYNTGDCGLVRSTNPLAQNLVFASLRAARRCPADAGECTAQEQSAWQDLQNAAAAADDPCHFASLVAYEWTDSQRVVDESTDAAVGATNHRNVIFGTDKVPAVPLDAVDYPTPPDLWTGLDRQCTAASGCEAITVPHNTNLSAGVSLVVWNPTPAGVAQQQRYQVSAEIYQHKAASECYYNPDAGYGDPECLFEYPAQSGPDGGTVAGVSKAVNLGPASFVRGGLSTGLGYAVQNPAQGNPLKLGIVGATDDHNGAPGNVDEATYVGHAGRLDDDPTSRLQGSPENGSGGLTGAWAEQNTRAAIFAAIKRRETFATSGPRIQLRFYLTSDAAACADPAFPKRIVDAQTGLPMGSTFGPLASGGAGAPAFAVTVWPDAVPQNLARGNPGVAGIAKVQVIKLHAHVSGGQSSIVEDPPYAVSGIPETGGCGTWTDPSFDATEYALYYIRALQVPTWRWSHYDCATLEANSAATGQTVPPGCGADGGLDVSVQERAWTSPIWFEP